MKGRRRHEKSKMPQMPFAGDRTSARRYSAARYAQRRQAALLFQDHQRHALLLCQLRIHRGLGG